jgi:hypothetical protein
MVFRGSKAPTVSFKGSKEEGRVLFCLQKYLTFTQKSLNTTYATFTTNESEKMKRIQRKRSKGWKMPSNAVYVGRPTKWGNPYFMEPRGQFTREQAIEAYENYIKRVLVAYPDFLDELKGKDLACWCPLDKPCHADVILKILKEES